jgi:hypothetical protein
MIDKNIVVLGIERGPAAAAARKARHRAPEPLSIGRIGQSEYVRQPPQTERKPKVAVSENEGFDA